MIEFEWKRKRSAKFGIVYFPVAQGIIFGPENEMKAEFLVDSGADISVIPYEAGIYLGFQLESAESIADIEGIGGSMPFVIRELQIAIGEYEFSARVAWSLSDEVPYLLGRMDIFDRFRIEFRKDELKTVFIPVPST